MSLSRSRPVSVHVHASNDEVNKHDNGLDDDVAATPASSSSFKVSRHFCLGLVLLLAAFV